MCASRRDVNIIKYLLCLVYSTVVASCIVWSHISRFINKTKLKKKKNDNIMKYTSFWFVRYWTLCGVFFFYPDFESDNFCLRTKKKLIISDFLISFFSSRLNGVLFYYIFCESAVIRMCFIFIHTVYFYVHTVFLKRKKTRVCLQLFLVLDSEKRPLRYLLSCSPHTKCIVKKKKK